MRKERGSSRPEDKGRPGLQKDCFWPFGPHFGPNITEWVGGGGGVVGLDPPLLERCAVGPQILSQGNIITVKFYNSIVFYIKILL